MRETAISVNKHIYQLLSSDSGLTSMVDNKIYPLVAEESVTYPFVIFTKESVSGNYSKDFLVNDTVTISVVVAANNYFQTVNIAERIRAILENYRDGYFLSILLDNVTEEFIEDAYIQQLQFSAKINEIIVNN
mgnify:CR=1 FL=1|jgi:hypothetical protein